MAFKFEDLQVWHRSMDLNDKLYGIVKDNFPREELYILTAQIRRAADSVVLNIAEGSTGQSDATFKLFLNYSLRSVIEVVSCLFIAKRRLYITDNIFDELYRDCETLAKMITSLRNSI